jgi:hypothetical protein
MAVGMLATIMTATPAFGDHYYFDLSPAEGSPASPEAQAHKNALAKLQWASSALGAVKNTAIDQGRVSQMISAIEGIQKLEDRIGKRMQDGKEISIDQDVDSQKVLVDAISSISGNVDWLVTNCRVESVRDGIKAVVGLDFVVKMASFILGQTAVVPGEARDTVPQEAKDQRQSLNHGEARLLSMLATKNTMVTSEAGETTSELTHSLYTESEEARNVLVTYANNQSKSTRNRATAIRLLNERFEWDDVVALVTELFKNVGSEKPETTEMRLYALDELTHYTFYGLATDLAPDALTDDPKVKKTRRFLMDFVGSEEKDEQVFSNVVYYLASKPGFTTEDITTFLQDKKSGYDRNRNYERDRIIGDALSGKLLPIPIDPNRL